MIFVSSFYKIKFSKFHYFEATLRSLEKGVDILNEKKNWNVRFAFQINFLRLSSSEVASALLKLLVWVHISTSPMLWTLLMNTIESHKSRSSKPECP